MTGLLALNGGGEHTPGCEAIDRRLLAESGVRCPVVTVLLAATKPRRKAFKIAEAQAYWRRFDVDLRIGYTGAPGVDEQQQALEMLQEVDLVVLTGGWPWVLHHNLSGTPVLQRILELWRSGVPVSGSSAGAMALCQWRPRLRPPNPLDLVDAFGLLPGTAAAPHFEYLDVGRMARFVVRRYTHVRAVGLPSRTALVGRSGEFTVHGEGPVSIVERSGTRQFPPGAAVLL